MKDEELLDCPHYHEPGKPYMSMHDRAAQFMPFKPLSRGHDFDQDDGDDGEAHVGK